MANGRRAAKGDDFVLYMMASVILGAGLAVAFSYIVFLLAGLGAFLFSILSMGMG